METAINNLISEIESTCREQAQNVQFGWDDWNTRPQLREALKKFAEEIIETTRRGY